MINLNEIRISGERLVRGKLIHAFRDTVRLPDGTTGIREWLDHPGAAAVVPLRENGNVVLIRQFRYPTRKVYMELPAGKMDHEGEDPENTARRELEEETGLTAEHLTSLGSIDPCIGYSNEVIHLFLAESLTESGPMPVDGEFVERFEIPFEKAVEMALDGDIVDAKTVVGLLRAQKTLAQRS